MKIYIRQKCRRFILANAKETTDKIPETKTYYFYVLYCQDNTLYGGFTTNLANRLSVHNDGKGAKYTRVLKRQPVQMIYAERFSSKSRAMQAEYRFKQLTRLKKERYLADHGQSDIRGQQLVLVNRVNEDVD